jgi:hypothetical protein
MVHRDEEAGRYCLLVVVLRCYFGMMSWAVTRYCCESPWRRKENGMKPTHSDHPTTKHCT